MKRLAALAALCLIGSAGLAQDPTRLYTRPAVPARETLHNLNLKMAWRTLLPVDGKRDGIASIQVLGDEVLVQLRNGTIVLLNGDTGQMLWLRLVGIPYRATIPPTANESSVIGINGTKMYSLERSTGSLQWEFDVPNAPTVSPVVDGDQVYVCLTGGRFQIYKMIKEAPIKLPPPVEHERPKPGKIYGAASSTAVSPLTSAGRTYFGISPLSSLTDASISLTVRYRIPLVYDYRADSRLEYPPLLTSRSPNDAGQVLLADATGSVFSMSKSAKRENYRFKGAAPVSAPLVQHQDQAYICLTDGTVYAMNIENGALRWQIAAPARVEDAPAVTPEDLYLLPESNGLMRLRRESGDVVWRNQDAVQFLAANQKFVYALDRTGFLLILDRERGTRLARHDTRDFVVPVSNTSNERLFLAANDGQLLCLYDRGSPPPIPNRRPGAAPPEGVKKEEPKKQEK